MLAVRSLVGFSLARLLPAPALGARWTQVAALAALAALATLVFVPHGALLERAHFTLAAAIGLVAVTHAWTTASSRARAVRWWILVAFIVWLCLHALKNVELSQPLPVPPDLLLIVLAATAAGAYQADLAGRTPLREQLAIYLDAAVVTAVVSAALIAGLAGRAFADPAVTGVLFYAIVFVGITSATLILDLAVLAELKLRGAYVLLAGIAAVAAGFVVRSLISGTTPEGHLAGWLISGGGLLVAYGAATWNDHVDDRPRYVAFAAGARRWMPLAAAMAATVLLIRPAAGGDELSTVAVQGLAAFALVGVAVRQSLLLREREAMLASLGAARGAAERRTQQIAGLEAVGRLLASTGPTEDALTKVIDVVAERFGYAHVAIYVADGGIVRLGAQRGYDDDLFPMLDGTRGVVGRVMRSRRAELVPDVATDPDYLMADADIRSEICAPMLDEGEFLGVIDVESTAEDRLDETDLAVVVAVADQLAGAIALALRRQRLLLERNFTSALLDTVAAAIVVTDPDGRVVRFNPACAEITGYSMEELRQQEYFSFLVPADSRAAVENLVTEVQNLGVPRNSENDWLSKDGTRRRLSWSNRPVLDEAGDVSFVLATGIDITERKQLEDQLAHRALHDPLTGLPNRALLMDRLEHALRRSRAAVGVLFIDLDGFKLINDTLGHEAGDLVLTRVASELTASLRPGDTAARVGGDEFAAVLENLADPTQAMAISERVRDGISQLRMEVHGTPVSVNASVGVATSTDGGHDAGELLRNADIAMYSAKTSGGARSAAFRDSMYATIVEQRDIERALALAVEKREFVLHYQPIVALRDRRVTGAEALLRWSHPDRGLLLPGEFLRVAELSGLIVDIGGYVLREACAQFMGWRAEEGARAPEWISVNVSPRQFEDGGLVEHVRQALAGPGMEPSRLVIEITETLMIDMSETTTATLRELRDLGVRFAIDDFGTGYSSLSYLRRLPVELLKIDRSFIAGVDVEPRQRSFVSALVAMGDTLGLHVLAEGIESGAQYQAVKQMGCELGQGHYLGSPVPADELVRRPR